MVEVSGPRLTEQSELLHRQVHPAFVRDGRVSSQAFRPSPKDEELLSVSRGSLANAESAYRLYVRRTNADGQPLRSAGVWSVTVEECTSVELAVYADPLTEPIEDAAHALVDFRGLSTKEREKRAQRLVAFARERGPLFEPPSQLGT